MMEKLGQAKTHLELKKMIAEVDTNGSGNYMCTYMLVNSYDVRLCLFVVKCVKKNAANSAFSICKFVC